VSWKQPLAEMQGKVVYIRPKVVGPFPGPCASGSNMHRAALFSLSPYDMATSSITKAFSKKGNAQIPPSKLSVLISL
jgi:hypothetical protein